MDSEKIMKLFDTCWFEMEILKKQSISSSSSNFEATPDLQNEEEPSKPEILRIPTTSRKWSMTMSSQLSSETSFNNFTHSPDSVLQPTKPRTILSETEITDEVEARVQEYVSNKKVAGTTRRSKKNGRSKSKSKSLSELEIEELKGFMDLGFVFTEEDNKDSRLVEIIPGLQRLGRQDDDTLLNENSAVSRPYLSESWKIMDSKMKESSLLMNWKIPPLNNEIDVKNSLRWWAQTVAMALTAIR